MLFTSGTTSQPKAVELTHNNLTSYVTGTVEFGSADADRRRADLRAAVPHRRRRRRAVEPVRRPKDGVPAQLRCRRNGCGWSTPSASPPRRWCPPCWTASSRCWRAGGHDAAVAAQPGLRRLEGRPAAGAQGAGAAARRRLRQRLRPDRDQLDDRGAHPRRPPRRAGRADEPAVATPARIGRPAGARHRGADPRRGRHRARRRARPASCSCAASRCRAGTPGSARCSTTNGWFPTKDIAMLDDEGYLFIGGRSRRHHHPRRREHRARRDRGRAGRAPARARLSPWSASRTRSGARSSSRWWCRPPAASPTPRNCAPTSASSLRGSRTPDRVVFRDELPTNADRQGACAGRSSTSWTPTGQQ